MGWQDVRASNVFHVLTDGEPGLSDVEEINACIADWYTNDEGGTRRPPRAYLPYNTSLGETVTVGILGRLPIPGISALAEFVLDTAQAGGNVAYPGASALVLWRSTGRGHWGVGRSYVGPIGDNYLAGHAEGRLSPLEAPGLADAWGSLVHRLAAWGDEPGRYRLVLRHAQPHFPSDGPEGLWNFITSGEIRDLRLRTQDRRVPDWRVWPAGFPA